MKKFAIGGLATLLLTFSLVACSKEPVKPAPDKVVPITKDSENVGIGVKVNQKESTENVGMNVKVNGKK